MSRFCVIAGTKISLSDGNSLPIEQIKAGEEVLSFDLDTLQRTQKYDVLVKLKTNNFSGIIKKDNVKNIWKNTSDEYFDINNKLKITGDHIVLAKRNETYFWTKVFNLKIGDYLFTEFNIFEKIDTMILIKEKVKVFNLEVNSIYNYFANSYLIHNGAPCSACDACGSIHHTIFAFSKDYTAYSASNSTDDSSNQIAGIDTNYHSFRDAQSPDDSDTPTALITYTGNTNRDNDHEQSLRSTFGVYANNPDLFFSPSTSTYSYVTTLQKQFPIYTKRLLLPFFNTTDTVNVYFKISNKGGSSDNAFGIGIIHKAVILGTSSSISADTIITQTYDESSDDLIPQVINANQFKWISESDKATYNNTSFGFQTYRRLYSGDYNQINNDSVIAMRADGRNNMNLTSTIPTMSSVTVSSKVTINDNSYDTDNSEGQPGGHGTGLGIGLFSNTSYLHTQSVGGEAVTSFTDALTSSNQIENGEFFGIEISIDSEKGQIIEFKYKKSGGSKKTCARYVIPSTIRGAPVGSTQKDFDLSALNSPSYTDGPWAVYVYDSTSQANEVQYTVVQDPG